MSLCKWLLTRGVAIDHGGGKYAATCSPVCVFRPSVVRRLRSMGPNARTLLIDSWPLIEAYADESHDIPAPEKRLGALLEASLRREPIDNLFKVRELLAIDLSIITHIARLAG